MNLDTLRNRHSARRGATLAWLAQCSGDDALFDFAAETPADEATPAAQAPWLLLIVDDDQQVHEATLLALSRERIEGRPLQFLHAHSAAAARELIAATPQIDLVLLDIVMETSDAGLRLLQALRGPLGRPDLRVLIRSGQPGADSDVQLAERHTANAYLPKTQQTRRLLLDTLHALLGGTAPHPNA
ncbi:MAG: response regulator [Candidatus Dactylopiibacterium sp.]|nr:response regulator [Candidatus Dactylopiibacterium sp.]